jgi:hypothetical protein
VTTSGRDPSATEFARADHVQHTQEVETERDRWNRNFNDLLQELRVAQTGVQILFAFLLTLPFSARFGATTEFQRDTYLVALLSAAAATALIISPVAFHRALFRQGRKPELVRYAHRVSTAGLGVMLVSMVSSILVITDFVLGGWYSILLTVLAGLWFGLFWVLLPFLRRRAWLAEEGGAPE